MSFMRAFVAEQRIGRRVEPLEIVSPRRLDKLDYTGKPKRGHVS